jgi:hypothetical protein
MRRRARWLVLVLVAALAYPVAVLATGAPRFPSPAECIRPAKTDGAIEAVFGRFSRQAAAEQLQRRALGAGFVGTKIEGDGCGRLKVDVQGISTLEVGRELAAEARKVGLDVSLERVQP